MAALARTFAPIPRGKCDTRAPSRSDLPRQSDVMMMLLTQLPGVAANLCASRSRLWIWAHLLLHTITVPLSQRLHWAVVSMPQCAHCCHTKPKVAKLASVAVAAAKGVTVIRHIWLPLGQASRHQTAAAPKIGQHPSPVEAIACWRCLKLQATICKLHLTEFQYGQIAGTNPFRRPDNV